MLLANSDADFPKVSGRVVSGEFIDHSTIRHLPTITGFVDFANKVTVAAMRYDKGSNRDGTRLASLFLSTFLAQRISDFA